MLETGSRIGTVRLFNLAGTFRHGQGPKLARPAGRRIGQSRHLGQSRWREEGCRHAKTVPPPRVLGEAANWIAPLQMRTPGTYVDSATQSPSWGAIGRLRGFLRGWDAFIACLLALDLAYRRARERERCSACPFADP